MGAGDDLGGLDRVAANERHFLSRTHRRSADAAIVLQCECTDVVCDGLIELTRAQYAPVRSSADRYAVHPHEAHVDPSVDQIVERQLSYWVVERRSSLEVLDFFALGSDMFTSELTSRVTEIRHATLDSEDDPESSV